MTDLKNYGRVFYGVGIAGIGIMHFFYEGFRPIIAPIPPETTEGISRIIYLIALYLSASGILICLGQRVKPVGLLLGLALFLSFLLAHLPNRLKYHPEISGYWIDAIKMIALSGGALVISTAFPDDVPNKFFRRLNQIAPFGKYMFAFMLCFFSIGHFTNAKPISEIVPDYIPWKLFWTYAAGVALFGSGLSIFINFRVRSISLLMAIVLFLWLVLLHLYYAFNYPEFRNGENITGSFTCLAFCGIAMVISATAKPFEVKH